MAKRNLIIPIFIPHLGCPHTCVFCNQKKIAGEYQLPTAEEIKNTVELYYTTFKNIANAHIELAFYGGSFTGLKKEIQEQLLSEAFSLKKQGKIQGIRLSTRPDYIDEEIASHLVKSGVDTVELGVQSLNEAVLVKSLRGHSPQDVFTAVKILKKWRLQVGIQLMPGLPGDSKDRVLDTTRAVIKLEPDFVRIYPTVVIKETQLAQLWQNNIFLPWSLEEAVEVCTLMAIAFLQADIPIIRIGLQKTENLSFDRDLLAGPYHPAFGEMVKSRIFRKQIEILLDSIPEHVKNRHVNLYCHPNDISQIKGQKLTNDKFFEENYRISFNLVPDAKLERYSIAIEQKGILPFLCISRREFLDKYRII
ncbi:MAG: elongator complex protein 3 [Bacillota bacterium]